ncbi:16S rRNA (guanine(527)-N(7))-methyltransferase RsmG [Xinfangfangia sp. CPCC 101601]|uniref:Ribosomal RNA small subunit methyltransferase G n=1 Tax=Pseudogemmobacter lacusdianii TaxID=3069608 RepID=A0ABU0VTZ0_9RHOB|nr:16S rRNA (guanine(527)-N(7))-methyltransferase RsmG [Xinfangfangia sp. CPCC 101601]MDQ2065178.1 16S rRNA (guanine(527)-N(7))-methyltransferase RsmG [Xinfangfangia sp. CPCC 101601]
MSVLDRLELSPAALEKLRLFQSLVEKWNPRINLVAKSTLPELWTRHIEDSAFLCLHAKPGKVWADFGSGGGFPGLVVAVWLQDRGAETQVVLVESDLRKATFLREAARQMGLSLQVHSERIETLQALGADTISARALASLDALCGLAAPHLAPEGQCLFPKGERFSEEIDAARLGWQFDLEAPENPGHKGSALLVLRNLRRV